MRFAVWGLGAMGSQLVKGALARGYQLVAAIDTDPAKLGRDAALVAGWPEPLGVPVLAEPAEALASRPALTFVATASFVPEVAPAVRQAIKVGSAVICLAEEMAYPWAGYPELAAALDAEARAQGVAVLGTGINPGFVLDALPIFLGGVCLRVDLVRAARVNDLAPFGPTVLRGQGVGLTPEQFADGLNDGSIVGHVGFRESLHLIARAFGWHLERITEERWPIISEVERQTPHVTVLPGQVAGCHHRARAYAGGRLVIELDHPQQVRPELAGVATGDRIELNGEPNLTLALEPEIPGGVGTVAMALNMAPLVLAAHPGLRCLLDLPLPRFGGDQ